MKVPSLSDMIDDAESHLIYTCKNCGDHKDNHIRHWSDNDTLYCRTGVPLANTYFVSLLKVL